MALLEDTNDQVKVQVTKVLPKMAGATPALIEGLCRRLLEDDSDWVQVHAALALSKLGSAAVAAGSALVRAAQTGEVSVREQAMRAIAMIQPPEGIMALSAGLSDANGEIRKVASAGLMKTKEIPAEVVPGLISALRDPEAQVRANAAHVLGRLDPMPAEAIPLLIECATDPSDGLRINAAMALKTAPPNLLGDVMEHLVVDPNIRVRLIAASALAALHPDDARVSAVLLQASGDPNARLRRAVFELVDRLGPRGLVFLDILQQQLQAESDPELRALFEGLIERLKQEAAQASSSIAGQTEMDVASADDALAVADVEAWSGGSAERGRSQD